MTMSLFVCIYQILVIYLYSYGHVNDCYAYRAVANAKQSLDISYITSRIIGESCLVPTCTYVCTGLCEKPMPISGLSMPQGWEWAQECYYTIMYVYTHSLIHSYTHAAMSYPHDDPFHQNNLGTVRAFLDEKHPSSYLVFNLSDHDYDASKLDNHVSKVRWLHCML